jgi:hypothetical protein
MLAVLPDTRTGTPASTNHQKQQHTTHIQQDSCGVSPLCECLLAVSTLSALQATAL